MVMGVGPDRRRTAEVGAAAAAETRAPGPIIFLLGPPGAGQSALGSRACRELGIRFLDLATRPAANPTTGEIHADRDRLNSLVADHAAGVIELPWPLQRERKVQVLARKSGIPLLLWAHPEDMQARSGREERLFTPLPRLKIRGGFGRMGTACREFRHLERACKEVLLLVDLPFEEAARAVRDSITEIRAQSDASPAEREGLDEWVEEWRQDHRASPRVTQVIVDVMARYLAHLRSAGRSPRTLSGIRSDLNAAGHVVLMDDAPKGTRILECSDGPPWTYEFERKFTDRPALVAHDTAGASRASPASRGSKARRRKTMSKPRRMDPGRLRERPGWCLGEVVHGGFAAAAGSDDRAG